MKKLFKALMMPHSVFNFLHIIMEARKRLLHFKNKKQALACFS